eukprot:scaffold3141_cov350-Prasinococcus_capsulatus_cf.AAC.4
MPPVTTIAWAGGAGAGDDARALCWSSCAASSLPSSHRGWSRATRCPTHAAGAAPCACAVVHSTAESHSCTRAKRRRRQWAGADRQGHAWAWRPRTADASPESADALTWPAASPVGGGSLYSRKMRHFSCQASLALPSCVSSRASCRASIA